MDCAELEGRMVVCQGCLRSHMDVQPRQHHFSKYTQVPEALVRCSTDPQLGLEGASRAHLCSVEQSAPSHQKWSRRLRPAGADAATVCTRSVLQHQAGGEAEHQGRQTVLSFPSKRSADGRADLQTRLGRTAGTHPKQQRAEAPSTAHLWTSASPRSSLFVQSL